MLQAGTRAQLQAAAQQLREERADRAGKEQDAADAIALRDEAIQELKDMLKEEKVSPHVLHRHFSIPPSHEV